MADERYQITCKLCEKTSEVSAPDPDEAAFLSCPNCGARLEIRWREPMTEPAQEPAPEPALEPAPEPAPALKGKKVDKQ